MARLNDRLRWPSLEQWVTAGLVVFSVAFVFVQMDPSKLLANTTAAGGDMGAHVWGPAYLRDELLPRWRLSGWTPDWYAGFPAYQFYMVLPSLLIVVLDVVLFLPYNVAFKLVTVSGLLALPVAAWALGRLARLPFPAPALLAVATVPFIFDRSFSIYGGNAASTLAGEFAFSISLPLAVLFLGVVLRGLHTGRSRALAAVLLGLTVCCHLIPAIFALAGAAAALLLSFDWRRPIINKARAWWLASVVVVGGLLTSFWTVPFVLRRSYMTDMGWEKVPNYLQPLFPGPVGDWFARMAFRISDVFGDPAPVGKGVVEVGTQTPADITLVIALAVVGVVVSILNRRRFGIWLTLTAAIMAIGFVVAPQGRLWNARLLPFWYLCLYFLAALAVAELIASLVVLLERVSAGWRRGVEVAAPVLASIVAFVLVALPLHALPGGNLSADGSRYSWLGISTADRSVVPSWVDWNYSGYERKAAYPEYEAVVSTMEQVGDERGCGRAMWEYASELDRFGTPMALMLLPYWTDGCIGSMEGLYFEASATTPYHFLNQAELSAAPSSAQRGLPYGSLDIAAGVRHLQLMGVRYYMAFSESAVAQAAAEPQLTEVATSGDWRVYEVAGAELVAPLTNRPAVVTDIDAGHEGWQDMAVDWYLDPSRQGVVLAADGPDSWERIRQAEVPEEVPTADGAQVTNIRTDEDTISFDVSKTGAPVLVKASYFPNWKADNADGPYRIAPNLMVVVPTGEHVTLEFGRTPVDWLGILLTLLGIGLAVVLARRPALVFPERPRPQDEPEPNPDPFDDGSTAPEAEAEDDAEPLAPVGHGEPGAEQWAPPEARDPQP